MYALQNYINDYLDFCTFQKKLSPKTIKAYLIDLKQFSSFQESTDGQLNKSNVAEYISQLHKRYSPKSVRRKIACLKAFINYLEFEEIICLNPFSKMKVKFQEPILLPRTMSLGNVKSIFEAANKEFINDSNTDLKKRDILRDIAVLELLFATGVRVSELCALETDDVDIIDGIVRIFGKGSRERVIQITNKDVLSALERYKAEFLPQILKTGSFFINRLGKRLSEQSVRNIIRNYTDKAGITLHITPHMFRHTFATLLLDGDVDIRYIQQLLGHSSIITTQIYTHVTTEKQRSILSEKHPRNKITI